MQAFKEQEQKSATILSGKQVFKAARRQHASEF